MACFARMGIVGALALGASQLASGCSSEDGGVAGNGGRAAAGGGAGIAGDGAAATGGGGGIVTDTGKDCPGGCDGGVCIDGACCPVALACGATCCASSEVCSFQKCETPGAECLDASECPEGHYCDYSLGEAAPDSGTDGGSCQGGVSLATGRCLPKPPQCAPGVEPEPGQAITCLPACEYRPPTGTFAPKLKYHWAGGNVMMAPIVIQLDDDNCDQIVDERDIPEIVFSSFDGTDYNHAGTLWAISMVDQQVVVKWSKKPSVDAVHPGRSIAAGNIDGLPGNEVVVCTDTGRVRAFAADGSELWTDTAGGGCFMPSLGDLDGDGQPEVVVESRVLNGKTGALKATLTPANTANIVLSDMNGDGRLEIVTPSSIYAGDGTLIADTGLTGTYNAVGDFDKDGVPEVASIHKPSHTLSVWHYDPAAPGKFEVLRTGIDINGTFVNNCPTSSSGYSTGGGPPTIADFNGDGTPDVAVAGGIGYAVIDGSKILDPNIAATDTNLWLSQTHDCSSAATGSSVFDFEGDGEAEVVYSDEHYLRVYRGTDGSVLLQTCNTTGTLFEFPLVADVDNDGHADIVVVANDYSNITCPDDGTKQRGVRVFGDDEGKWVRTRRIWNQHAYHVTNVAENGDIPANELPNWMQPRLNNFRQNVQPLGEFSAPDLIVSIFPRCDGDYGLIARVRNIGTASVPPGVVVGFYAGDPAAGGTKLGSGVTTKALYPAESEDVVLPLASPPAGVQSGATPIYAVVDDGSPPHAWHECRTDNNTSDPGNGSCNTGPA